MDFKSLIGQARAARILTRTTDKDHLPNSLLFAGPEGVGKWAAALALASYINCKDRRAPDPETGIPDSCGKCGPCKQIRKLQYPNLYIAVPTPPSKNDREENENYWEILNRKIEEPYALISGKRQMSIPIAAVRAMKKSLSQKPSTSGKRVVIIEQMDRMKTASGDALLKLIEEPPSQTLIIITTSRPDKLLPTIISRCRRLRFANLPEREMENYLIERSGLSQSRARLLSRLSQGSLGRALYLSEDENNQDREVAKLVFNGLFSADIAEVIAESADVLPVKDRFRLNRINTAWQSLFRDLMVLRNGGAASQLINSDFAPDLERLAGLKLNARALLNIPDLIGSTMHDIDLNVETRTAIGALLIRIQKDLQA